MLHLLQSTQYASARSVFAPLEIHLVVTAVLEGVAPGRVWVDDPLNPASGFLQAGHRCHLSGRANNPAFNTALRRLFLEEIYPQAQGRDEVEFILYYASPDWEGPIQTILEGKEPIFSQRQYYEFRGSLDPTWRERIPPGFYIQRIDPGLMGESGLENLADLREETTSETPSLDFFLEKRFGFCLRSQSVIAGWCLSEYNCSGRCEIGIETAAAFQKRGLAQITASALIEHACANGITRIGWDCWASNIPSVRTALRIGFEKVRDYQVAFAWFDPAANLAVHGNLAFQAGQIVEARAWFTRAFQAGQPPLWAYVVAAFASNCLGDGPTALGYLRTALDRGFEGLDWICGSDYLQNLHSTPEWKAWFGSD